MKKIFLLILAVAVFASCEKEKTNDLSNYADVDFSVTTESLVETEAKIDDVTESANYEVELYTGSDDVLESGKKSTASTSAYFTNPFTNRYKLGQCPDIHIVSEEGGFPKTITLDYGQATVLENGHVLSGIVEIVITGPIRENGSSRTVTFESFSVDTIGIAGTKVKTFLSDDKKVNVVSNLEFTLKDGTVISRDAEKDFVWVEGWDTPGIYYDNIFSITGFANVEDSDGNIYSRVITKPLHKRGGCRFIVKGEVSLYKNNVLFATIDYGNGECNDTAIMTTAEGRKEIRIGKWGRVRK